MKSCTTAPVDDLGSPGTFAATYLRDAPTLSYAALVRSQQGPWPGVAFGAAGVAYALWRANQLDAAERLLHEADRASLSDYAISDLGARDYGASLYYGPAGVGYVRLLVARARHDEATYERELRSYIARCRVKAELEDELLLGAAGLLNGSRILYRHTGDRRLRPIADALSEGLLRRKNAWMSTSHGGFGHGASGILHALLSWSHQASVEPALGVLDALARLADATDELHPATRAEVPVGLQRSWCNGSTGHALLWAKAYEATRDRRYLQLARANALTTFSHVSAAGADLCCGLGGRAFACLAMDRVEPERGWLDRASELAARAVLALNRRGTSWKHGLFKGSPGLVCLVHDLASEPRERAGFPLVEG